MFGTPDGTPAESGSKLVLPDLGQSLQVGCQCQGRGLEGPFRSWRRVDIVRADVKTIIAAEDPVPQLGSQFVGDLVTRSM